MTRKPLVAGNWKMNLTAPQGVQLIQKLENTASKVDGLVEVVVAPPFTALHSVSTVIEIDRTKMILGAQNMHWEAEGAYTGEVSPLMLKSLRVTYVIVGHSERRELFHEDNAVVNRKVKSAFAHDLTPILCCGETLETREQEETLEFIETQIREGLAGVNAEQAETLVVAYEPIWAIGTGKTATPYMAQEVCGAIRSVLAELFGEGISKGIRILYGGSVKAENAAMFFNEPDIDGALVGGAALNADAFAPIIKAAAPH